VRVLVGLIALAKRSSTESVERACEIAVSYGAYRLRVIRRLVKREGVKQEWFDFLKEHPIIRPLGEYGELVRASIRGESRQVESLQVDESAFTALSTTGEESKEGPERESGPPRRIVADSALGSHACVVPGQGPSTLRPLASTLSSESAEASYPKDGLAERINDV
jgi:hypothetical protein